MERCSLVVLDYGEACSITDSTWCRRRWPRMEERRDVRVAKVFRYQDMYLELRALDYFLSNDPTLITDGHSASNCEEAQRSA